MKREKRKHKMLPPPPRKRKKEIVLPEDEYMERLGSIIERDFFPDLTTERRRVEDEDHTVDSFVNTHTTEDNRSFEKLQEKSLKKHRDKYWWAYEEKKDKQYRARNHLMFPPSLKQSCEISKVDVARIKDKPTLLSLKDDESVNRADCDLALQRIEKAKRRTGKLDGKPKSILHRNTQLETSTWSTQRRINNTSSSKQQELGNEQSQQKHVWSSGTEGYDYVRTPSIDPDKHGMTPLMTWGDVESTPLRVASSTMNDGDQRKEFKIASQSKREQVHHLLDRELRARNSQRRRKFKPSRRTPTRMLSPAAQQLASRVNRGNSSFTSTLRASYGSSSSLKIRPRRRSRKRSESFSSAGSSSATDGLLEL